MFYLLIPENSPTYTNYYGHVSGEDPNPSVGKAGNPFTETRYDNSPLNRVEEVSGPGDDFMMSLRHTVKTKLVSGPYPAAKYITRNDSLLRGGSWTDQYSSNYLYGTRTEDENTVNKNGTTYEYKDWSGKVILKRTTSQDNKDRTINLSTYYVYDERDNLCFILTPRVNPDSADAKSR